MAKRVTQERIKRLEKHLEQENPVLAGCVQSFQKLDRIARKLGLMDSDDSYATQVSWWPVISVLGTYSAGKSTFMNQYVGQDLQRNSTLLITDHIIDLSDLVLVFFDARRPEPGAMADTLKHLVGNTVQRPDSTKFLYILNQIDNTAREDNPEEVVAAWQRSLARQGLTAGRFYRIYARNVTLQLEDPQVQERLERKRDEDLGDIEARIRQVEVERAYRVVGVLEKTAKHIRDVLVPRLAEARRRWRRRTFWLSGSVFALIAAQWLHRRLL